MMTSNGKISIPRILGEQGGGKEEGIQGSGGKARRKESLAERRPNCEDNISRDLREIRWDNME
jgi:hypothetical protein